MRRVQVFELAMLMFSILVVSSLSEQLFAGSFFIMSTMGLMLFLLSHAEFSPLYSWYFDEKDDLNMNEDSPVNLQPEDIPVDLDLLHHSLKFSPTPVFLTDMHLNVTWISEMASTNPITKHIKLHDSFLKLIAEKDQSKVRSITKFIEDEIVIPPIELSPFVANDKHKNKDSLISIQPTKVSLDADSFFILQIYDISNIKTLEANIVHSQKMQALGRMSGTIAHDFNNLLTAIIGFSDILLQRHPPGNTSFTELMQIKQNASRAANLVRQLLAFSRKQVMQPKIINITDTVDDMTELMLRLAGSEMKINISHGASELQIKADRGQIEQVILNLVINARDAMGGVGEIELKTNKVYVDHAFFDEDFIIPVGDSIMQPGNYVMIEVSDNGSGIPTEIVEQVFEPFFSTKGPESGTGLGLATVLGILNQADGHLRFKTSEKCGTSFFVFLPITEANTEMEENIQEEPSEDYIVNPNIATKILLVEDEPSVRMYSVYALSNKGYNVLEAESAEEAISLMNEEGENIDLIITDVMMEGMDGPEMIENIKKEYPFIKVIFISGFAEDSLEYLQQTNGRFLSKPYTIKELISCVSEELAVDKLPS